MSLISEIPRTAIGIGLKVARLPIDATLGLIGAGRAGADPLREASDGRAERAVVAERRRREAERRRQRADEEGQAREKAQRERLSAEQKAKRNAAARKRAATRSSRGSPR
jgi:hypothetical protein